MITLERFVVSNMGLILFASFAVIIIILLMVTKKTRHYWVTFADEIEFVRAMKLLGLPTQIPGSLPPTMCGFDDRELKTLEKAGVRYRVTDSYIPSRRRKPTNEEDF